jgi:hypothetical protein
MLDFLRNPAFLRNRLQYTTVASGRRRCGTGHYFLRPAPLRQQAAGWEKAAFLHLQSHADITITGTIRNEDTEGTGPYTTAVFRCEKFAKSKVEKHYNTFHLYVVNIVLSGTN